MIELRWLVSPRNDTERVLQWRYQRPVLYEENHETRYRMTYREEWSPWADVPEVIAELPQKERQ